MEERKTLILRKILKAYTEGRLVGVHPEDAGWLDIICWEIEVVLGRDDG